MTLQELTLDIITPSWRDDRERETFISTVEAPFSTRRIHLNATVQLASLPSSTRSPNTPHAVTDIM